MAQRRRSPTPTPNLPHPIDPNADDPEIVELIASWRYGGRPTPWDAVVGHESAVARCRELVEKLGRPEADLERLRIRLGRGIVIAGPPGVGKTALARALATAAGRPVIAPPTSELTAPLIARLYAQLTRMGPAIVILDEAESVIGQDWIASTAPECVRALCAALDGIDRPHHGPITVALTTRERDLSPTVTRPGRLAPRLVLELPTEADRRTLLLRAIDGLPLVEALDVEVVVSRMTDWSGAEIVVAVEEAMSRSLIDGIDALDQRLLLQVIAERYVVRDEPVEPERDLREVALHEAGHGLAAALLLGPAAVALMETTPRGGRTVLTREIVAAPRSIRRLRDLVAITFAGMASERAIGGPDEVTNGSLADRSAATEALMELVALRAPYDPGTLESGTLSDRGSERMRAALHVAIETEAASALERTTELLAGRRVAIVDLAERLLAAPGHTLSGPDLVAALREALAR